MIVGTENECKHCKKPIMVSIMADKSIKWCHSYTSFCEDRYVTEAEPSESYNVGKILEHYKLDGGTTEDDD